MVFHPEWAFRRHSDIEPSLQAPDCSKLSGLHLVVRQLPSDGRISRSQNSRITARHFEHGNLRFPSREIFRSEPSASGRLLDANLRLARSERPALGILRSVLTRRTKLDAALGRSSPGVCEEGRTPPVPDTVSRSERRPLMRVRRRLSVKVPP